MATTRVTRRQIAGSSFHEEQVNREGASSELKDSDAHSGRMFDWAAQVRIKELETEALKLQIELQKLKLQSQQNDTGLSDRCDLAWYVEQLRVVFSPMPVSDDLVPAWFRSW
ncbi:hypothetical protein HPB50_003181 [Hyalomma asiaticum]|uniref:Uncharacterized protein n=1 Tax=Hyalomma asiaticum TaxID=266040 RepID=A0ACB7RV58_HYAAI|nr:hypothetical protein HPB50_003181 [Hyalomma asiaticum]